VAIPAFAFTGNVEENKLIEVKYKEKTFYVRRLMND
jgi:hypothetical protein